MIDRKNLCDENCNECPIVNHPNNRMLNAILENLNSVYGETYEIVTKYCTNMTVCYDCKLDDFCHFEGCITLEPPKEKK